MVGGRLAGTGRDVSALADAPAATQEFVEVFKVEFPRLAGYCSGLVGSAELGSDLAQEALTRTWGRWVHVAQPGAYAYLVATNLVRAHWKRSALEARTRSALHALVEPAVHPLDLAVRDLVDRLPERLRVVTLLHYYADLPVEEVARLVHRPAGTIKRRLHEAREILAHQFEQGERA